jgi:Uma2 family endonuclease
MSAPVDAEWVASTRRALDLPKSVRLRYGGGVFLLVPMTSAHFRNRFALGSWARSVPGVRGGARFALRPPVDGYVPEPDFALIDESAHAPQRDSYQSDEVPFIAEMISTDSEQRHYARERNHYARVGIPAYLVVDVLTAEWTLFTEPREGAYTLTATGNFCAPIPVEVAGQPHPIDSGEFEHL